MADGRKYKVQPGDSLSLIVVKNPDLGYKNWQELLDTNKAEILRVGRDKMAARGIGENVTRGPPCGLTEHTDSVYATHLIENGIHYDSRDVPTIYPGTELFLKNISTKKIEPKKETPQKQGKVISKKWTGVEHQSPAPKLEIFTNCDPNTVDIEFSPDPKAEWSKLLGYNFTEATDSLEGAFSFTVENEENKKSPFDLIPVRSIVKIYEGDLKHAAFVGIIRRKENKKTMTSQGVKRSIVFSGKSVISCIAEYTVSLDIRIQDVADAMSKNIDLTTGLADIEKPLTIKTFMKETWNHFKKVSEGKTSEGKANAVSNTGIAEVIEKFIGDFDKFMRVTGKGQTIRYDIACVFYNAATNVIADVWRNILPEKVYEFFSRCENGEPKIITRQVPFEPEDWSGLDIYEISPISLTAYDITQTDEEVYTAFMSYVIGSEMSKEFYMAVSQTMNDSTVKFDEKKRGTYGFKPLQVDFYGYDRKMNSPKNSGNRSKLEEDFRELNKMTHYWYSRLDEMYSGGITIATDFNEPETNPRAGCRAKFLGGEFYINKADHSWNFGGTPTIRLSVSRGMIYDNGGKIKDGKDGIIKDVGKRFRELEREAG